MPREVLSTVWLLGGYFVLILLMGVFVTRIQKMRGIKSQPAILGALIWTIGMIAYAILGNSEMSDPLMFISISVIIPLLYLVMVLVALLSRKYHWKNDSDPKIALRYLAVFLALIAVYAVGLVLV
jgi:magnesium-transporting ATPase (P-type)